MTFFLLSICGLYAFFTILLGATWQRMPFFRPDNQGESGTAITVIIPVRNESENIGKLLHDLARQTYAHFEVIVADDSSTDDTLQIVQQFAHTAPYALRALPLSNERTASPKKRAITQSIAIASGQLIVTTDGDCRVGPDWLKTLADFYDQTRARLISGPVTFIDEKTLFDDLQTVEFASLIGTGACTMALGTPTMCNGANLCYERRVFTEVNGFSGIDQLASGDDELLMHKIAARYPQGVRFLKSQAAVVQTTPHQTWRGFYQQRKRWASKWRAYASYLPSALAIFVFLCNAAPVVAVGGWLAGMLNGNVVLIVIGLKLLPEFLYLRQILVFLQKKSSVYVIPLTQLLYPFYVLFFGLVAQGKGYRWKGRDLN